LQSSKCVARTSRKPQHPPTRQALARGTGTRGAAIFPVPYRPTRQEHAMYDLPWWVMGIMLLAVVGLIVLLIYLRKKDRE